MKKRLLLATGQESINREIVRKGDFEVAGIVEKRENLEGMIYNTDPSIVLVGEGMSGEGFLPSIIIDVKSKFPFTRIIYLAGEIPVEDEARVQPLQTLVKAGIYDIIHSAQIKKKALFELLHNPMSKRDVAYLLDIKQDKSVVQQSVSDELSKTVKTPDETGEKKEEDLERIQECEPPQVISFSSIKPGTGKSFLAVNVAAAIAQFGANRKDGERPKVAIIEADLQNLPLGTLLKMEDENNKLSKAVDIISRLMDSSGIFIQDKEILSNANKELVECLIPYGEINNLHVLSGSHESCGDASNIPSHYYSYLISALKPNYDYIIINSNTSMNHSKTFPIIKEVDKAFYILTLDFNNVRRNIRYQKDLAEWRVLDKVRYVLNEDYVSGGSGGKLAFGRNELEDVGFTLQAAVPTVEKSIFLNAIHNGTPLVLGSDKSSKEARYEILKLANSIHPIKNFPEENEGKKKRLFKWKR